MNNNKNYILLREEMLKVKKQLNAIAQDIKSFKNELKNSLLIDDISIEEELLDLVLDKTNNIQYNIANNIIPSIDKKI